MYSKYIEKGSIAEFTVVNLVYCILCVLLNNHNAKISYDVCT